MGARAAPCRPVPPWRPRSSGRLLSPPGAVSIRRLRVPSSHSLAPVQPLATVHREMNGGGGGGRCSAQAGVGMRPQERAPPGTGTRGSLCRREAPCSTPQCVLGVCDRRVSAWIFVSIRVCVRVCICMSGCLCALMWVSRISLKRVFPRVSELMCVTVSVCVCLLHLYMYLCICVSMYP